MAKTKEEGRLVRHKLNDEDERRVHDLVYSLSGTIEEAHVGFHVAMLALRALSYATATEMFGKEKADTLLAAFDDIMVAPPAPLPT